jgi:hypothetical protein
MVCCCVPASLLCWLCRCFCCALGSARATNASLCMLQQNPCNGWTSGGVVGAVGYRSSCQAYTAGGVLRGAASSSGGWGAFGIQSSSQLQVYASTCTSCLRHPSPASHDPTHAVCICVALSVLAGHCASTALGWLVGWFSGVVFGGLDGCRAALGGVSGRADCLLCCPGRVHVADWQRGCTQDPFRIVLALAAGFLGPVLTHVQASYLALAHVSHSRMMCGSTCHTAIARGNASHVSVGVLTAMALLCFSLGCCGSADCLCKMLWPCWVVMLVHGWGRSLPISRQLAHLSQHCDCAICRVTFLLCAGRMHWYYVCPLLLVNCCVVFFLA